jgi:integrase
MPKRALTQLAVDRLGPPATGRVEFWDAHLRGFGLRVSASGAKSWIVMYRVRRDGKQVRETLGTLAEIPSVAEARKRALVSLEKARAGVNPVAERREVAARVVAEERGAFAAVATRFLAEHVERNCRPKTARETRRIIERDLIPRWRTRPIRDIARRDVNDLLDDKAETAPLQANEVRKHLLTLFRWALDAELIDANPIVNVRKRAKEVARDRALSDPEIKLFWAGCDRLGWPFGPLFRLLLATAQRREEVGAARWAEFDLEKRIWTIPRERAKNDKAHEVALSSLALEILEGLPRTGEMLFSAKARAPSGYSKAKDRVDEYMGEVPPWTLHDLRRSAATGMAALGMAPHVVDRVLNHTGGTIRGVAAVYNRFQYGGERTAALEAWGRHIESLVRPGSPGNVVDLRATA